MAEYVSNGRNYLESGEGGHEDVQLFGGRRRRVARFDAVTQAFAIPVTCQSISGIIFSSILRY